MTAIIILAAGQSSRLGKPKQLLPYQEANLLQHTINTALKLPYRPVIVVLGAFADDILTSITPKPIEVIVNTQWEEGMASSIRAGIDYLQKSAQADDVIIMLCDQPHVDAQLLSRLVKTKQQTGKGIIACGYNDTAGVPVLFDQKYFPELLGLIGHEGAKKLLSAHSDDVVIVPFPMAAVDIDTDDDYKNLDNK